MALRDSNGETFLHRAVRRGNVCVIKYLLAEGIDTTITNNQGETAVHLASNKPHILQLFFDHYGQLIGQSEVQEPVIKKARHS